MNVLYQFFFLNQGVTHFPFSLSSGFRAVGVVYSEGNSPFGRSHFGGSFS